ncbi:MAG: hypothetical protein KBD37_08810 [Burkholderiales bacterium]|nr:hypothetical protein [Burkholderiales bacterium]
MTLHYRGLSDTNLETFSQHLISISKSFKNKINPGPGMYTIASILFDMNLFIYNYLIEQNKLDKKSNEFLTLNIFDQRRIEGKINRKKSKILTDFNTNVRIRGKVYAEKYGLDTLILDFVNMVTYYNNLELLIASGIIKAK